MASGYRGFLSMKQTLGALLLPPRRDASQLRVTPQQYVAGIHFYTWV